MLALLSLAPLAVTALALPTAVIPSDPETWTIPRLDLHFMTSNSGLPGGGWDPSLPHFDSTISFDVQVPFVARSDSGDFTATCQASFANGTIPMDTISCTGTPSDETFSFNMRPFDRPGGPWRPELAFTLSIFSNRKALAGSTPVTGDFTWAQSEPLRCFGGAPLDGDRCHLVSNITVEATPI